MHKIFGKQENGTYLDRKGAYIIPVIDDKVGIIETAKGLFFIGGGIEAGETERECAERECMEETGYPVEIKEKICSAETYCVHPNIGLFHPIQVYYSCRLLEKIQEPTEPNHKLKWLSYTELRGKMFTEMQNWALEQACSK